MTHPQLEILPLADLTPYARNARTHSADQIAQLVASLREFGFTNPVLIDAAGGIIAGHGRVLAAQQVGLASVPCLRLGHLTETQKRAYILADNRLALNAGWDHDLLAQELAALAAEDYDTGLTGFGDNEIADLLALAERMGNPDGDQDPDAVPEVAAVPISQTGDLWILGKHRLLCGSSTDADNVRTLLGGAVPHLMVTDPPYGIEYDADWRNKRLRADGQPLGDRAVGKVMNDDRTDWREAWSLFPGDVAYVWHSGLRSKEVFDSLTACGYEIRSQIIWAKNQLVIGRGNYHLQHEPCLYVVKKNGNAHWNGSRKQKTIWRFVGDQLRADEQVFIRHQSAELIYAISGDESTVWEIPKPQKSETGHSTQKPVECMRRPIQNNSKAGDGIYEPFSGSGTTIIAAEQLARRCYAMEISPLYVDVAVRRWQTFTGQTAIHEVTGQPFPG